MSFIITYINPYIKTEKDQLFLEKEKKSKTEKHKYKFNLYDDDGILYFRGVSKKNDTFEPLDDFGMSFGCTEIHFWNGEKYEEL